MVKNPWEPNWMERLTAEECEKLKETVKGKEEEYVWGTTGENFREELQVYPISQLSNQHLENILITQKQITHELSAAILMLLKKRYRVI